MKLINYENYQINIADEALLVAPFRKLFNLDKSKTKDKFLLLMAIIFFLKDPRSNYNYITDELERLKEILSQEGLPENYKISLDLLNALDIYEKLTVTTSLALLLDTRTAIDKVRHFLRTVDLTEEDDKGKPKYTINSITTTIKQIPLLAKDLMEAEKIVAKELEEEGRKRGSNTKKLFEDGIGGLR